MALSTEMPFAEIATWSCGCVDYHWADCPMRFPASDYDSPDPDEYSNLDYVECAHGDPAYEARYSFDGDLVTDSDGVEWVVCNWCDEKRKWEDVQNG